MSRKKELSEIVTVNWKLLKLLIIAFVIGLVAIITFYIFL